MSNLWKMDPRIRERLTRRPPPVIEMPDPRLRNKLKEKFEKIIDEAIDEMYEDFAEMHLNDTKNIEYNKKERPSARGDFRSRNFD